MRAQATHHSFPFVKRSELRVSVIYVIAMNNRNEAGQSSTVDASAKLQPRTHLYLSPAGINTIMEAKLVIFQGFVQKQLILTSTCYLERYESG
jgi:hypothetical protein